MSDKAWKLDGYVNKISWVTVKRDPTDRGEYFETWCVARHALIRRAEDRIERAKAELSNAKSAYRKALLMKELKTP